MKYTPGYEWFITPHWLRRFGPLRLVEGSLLDRIGLHFFTIYAVLGGVMSGTFTLNSFVLKEALHGSTFQVALISMLGSVCLLLGIFGSELADGRDKRPFIFWIGLVSRGSFLLYFFVWDAWSFIAVSTLFFVSNALLMPSVFAMWQANVSPASRNRLWGLTVTLSTIVSMACAAGSGYILDLNQNNFKWLFAVSGLIGMLGTLILAQSPLRGKYKLAADLPRPDFRKLLIEPIHGFVALLKRDRPFLHFESAFFLYGSALMLMFPVMPFYLKDVIGMSYAEIGIAQGPLAMAGVIMLSPVWGKFMDGRGPAALCSVIFAILSIFPLSLMLGLHGFEHGSLILIVYCAYLVFGIGMSGINVAWSLAPVTFARGADASPYSGAHVTITGIRGAIAPMLGAVMMSISYEVVFISSATLFLLGSLGMILHRRHYRYEAAEN
ncbi:MFS transporter [bacterium]|nr:MFS transporter [bacterium]